MKLLQTLETCSQHSPALFPRRTISSHRLGRAYSGSRSWRLPNPPPSNSPASLAASVSASSSTGGFLARSGIGKSLGAYSQIQAKRPYTTQICTTIVIWLCGDLSAQFLFSSNDVRDEEIKSSTQCRETQKNLPGSQGYDPWRTARHLTVGIVASIPSYEWYVKGRLNQKVFWNMLMTTGSCFSTAGSTLPQALPRLPPRSLFNRPSSRPSSTPTFSLCNLCCQVHRLKTLWCAYSLHSRQVSRMVSRCGRVLLSSALCTVPPQFRSVFPDVLQWLGRHI
jgi:hypothetical protein